MEKLTQVLIPSYSRGERIADRALHCAGLVAAVIGSIILIVAALESKRVFTIVSVCIYSIGLLGMMGASALYNYADPSCRKDWCRRLDHAAVFLMIASTYTPFALRSIGESWKLGMFVFVWLVAMAGMAMKLLYPRRFERLSLALYLTLGWLALIALGPLNHTLSSPTVILLGIGGLFYSMGVFFHLWHRLPYHNVAWHLFVIIAACCHWVAVLNGVVRVA